MNNKDQGMIDRMLIELEVMKIVISELSRRLE